MVDSSHENGGKIIEKTNTLEKELFLEMVNEKRFKIEKMIGEELESMRFIGENGIEVDVSFDYDGIEIFGVKVPGWDPYTLSDAVEKLFKMYYMGSCSFLLTNNTWVSGFKLSIYEVRGFKTHRIFEIKATHQTRKYLKNAIKEILDTLGMKYEENSNKIKMEKYQSDLNITPENIRELYEKVIGKNKIHIYIPSYIIEVVLSDHIVEFLHTDVNRLDEVERFLNEYGKSLYKTKYKIDSYSIRLEKKSKKQKKNIKRNYLTVTFF